MQKRSIKNAPFLNFGVWLLIICIQDKCRTVYQYKLQVKTWEKIRLFIAE